VKTPEPLFINGGRYWDRTSDLFRVKEKKWILGVL